MSTEILILVAILMGLVQIFIFKSFPNSIRKFFAWSIITAMLVNFGISGMITAFTGVGTLVGIGNLAGSILFGLYLKIYKHKHEIGIARIKWKYGILPVLYIYEKKPFDHWVW